MAATAPTLRKALQRKSPSLAFERALWDAGHDVVVGIDEVGRGAWAGPLTLGAVVLPRDRRVYKVRDSKMLTEAEETLLAYAEGTAGRGALLAGVYSLGLGIPFILAGLAFKLSAVPFQRGDDVSQRWHCEVRGGHEPEASAVGSARGVAREQLRVRVDDRGGVVHRGAAQRHGGGDLHRHRPGR